MGHKLAYGPISNTKIAVLNSPRGLWSIRDDYTVLVAARHFAEAGKSAFLLARMQGRKIILPANPAHRSARQLLTIQVHFPHLTIAKKFLPFRA